MKQQIKLLLLCILTFSSVVSYTQILSFHGLYDDSSKLLFCVDTTIVDLDTMAVRTLNHLIVSGDSLTVNRQLTSFRDSLKKYNIHSIKIIEYRNSPEIRNLDPVLKDFEDISILIINNCPKLQLAQIVRYINHINKGYQNLSLKEYKKVFKKRPGIFYLNTLILKRQLLHDIGKPPSDLLSFNYLEEIRIESPVTGSQSQQFANTLVNEWIVPDTHFYLQSHFPNLRFLAFENCGLSQLPMHLKYKRDLISLDLSSNELDSIPACLLGFKSYPSLLSLDLSDNNIQYLDTLFVDQFTASSKKSSKFSKYLFLSNNQLDYEELKLLANKKYNKKFNTLTFECNPINNSGTDHYGKMLQLAKEIDKFSIAKFMTGAQRSETDYNPQLGMANCENEKIKTATSNSYAREY